MYQIDENCRCKRKLNSRKNTGTADNDLLQYPFIINETSSIKYILFKCKRALLAHVFNVLFFVQIRKKCLKSYPMKIDR